MVKNRIFNLLIKGLYTKSLFQRLKLMLSFLLKDALGNFLGETFQFYLV